jgi:acetyltransferase-like isoleucine patch superfamily enzyme
MSSIPQFSVPGIGRSWHVRLTLVRAVLGFLPAFTFNHARVLALRACGIRIGRKTMFWGLPRLTGRGAVASRLQVGAHCGFNDGCEFDLEAPISIGDHVSVGHEVRFLTSSGAEDGGIAAPITVGDGAWLGARCMVRGGVSIGAGSVIGAGVTVASDVAPSMLVTGGKPISLAKWR